MSKELGTQTPWGIIEPFQSNGLPVCLDCGTRIDASNDSGWEGFCSDGRTTQPLCKACGKIRGEITEKAPD